MLYEKVTTSEQLAVFNLIWITVWREKGFDLEYTPDPVDRYLILDGDLPVGTIEFRPLMASDLVDSVGTLYGFTQKLPQQGKLVVIDKVAILKPYRGTQNIGKIFTLIYVYIKENQVDYFFGLIEPLFARLLRIIGKNVFRNLGEKFFYKGDYVLPILVDSQEMLKDNQLTFLKIFQKYAVTTL